MLTDKFTHRYGLFLNERTQKHTQWHLLPKMRTHTHTHTHFYALIIAPRPLNFSKCVCGCVRACVCVCVCVRARGKPYRWACPDAALYRRAIILSADRYYSRVIMCATLDRSRHLFLPFRKIARRLPGRLCSCATMTNLLGWADQSRSNPGAEGADSRDAEVTAVSDLGVIARARAGDLCHVLCGPNAKIQIWTQDVGKGPRRDNVSLGEDLKERRASSCST